MSNWATARSACAANGSISGPRSTRLRPSDLEELMSQTPASKVKGLHKHHSRGCPNRGGKPTNCDCPWYAFYKRVQKGLAEWSGQRVDPRKLRPAEIVLNRLKSAIDNRTYSPAGEQQSLGSGQRFSEFIKEWRTHYAEAHRLTANSLSPMLDVVVEAFGDQTLE